MKRTQLLLVGAGLILATNLSAQSDVRTINGIKVDLTPIHEWTKKPKGDRPMAHWKWVTLVEAKGAFGTGWRCILDIEEVGQREVFVQKPPPVLLDILQREQAAAAAALHAANVAEVAKREKRAWEDETTRRISSAYSYESYAQASLAERQARRVEEDATKASAQAWEISEALREARLKWKDLAMFTGKKVAGLECWSFGEK